MKELLEKDSGTSVRFKPTSELYPEIWACEWEYYYPDGPSLSKIYDAGQSIFDYSDHEDIDIFDIFKNAILEGIISFKNKNTESSKLFLGYQVADPDEGQAKVVENILMKVNSEEWRSKIAQVYSPIVKKS